MTIWFRGEVGDNQSWGISTIGNVKGFLSLGHRVTIDPMNQYGNIPEEVRECINRRYGRYDVFIRQGLAKHMQELVGIDRSLVKISLSCWDSSLVDESTAIIHNLYADGVLALSSFTKQAFLDAGTTIPIYTGGQGFDDTVFYPKKTLHNENIVFLTVGVAQGRKGTNILIRAFEKALGDVNGAKLIIKSNSWGDLKDYGTKVKNIEKIYEEYTPKQMGELYRNSDCFVLPTEGDSFALPGIEAMATGLPLIITGFGGPCDYCTDETGYRIHYKLKDASYLPGYQAIPDEDHLAELLHYVFTHINEAREKGEAGARKALLYWTWRDDARRNEKFLLDLINRKRA